MRHRRRISSTADAAGNRVKPRATTTVRVNAADVGDESAPTRFRAGKALRRDLFHRYLFVYTSLVIDDQSAALAALGDHTRRAIVVFLADRPQAVGELADQLPVSRPAVSQHLRVLKDAGLVSEHAVGTRRIHRLNPAAMGALRAHFELLWRRALTSPTEAADEPKVEA